MKRRHDKLLKRLHKASERCLTKMNRRRWARQARAYTAAARLIQHARRALLLPSAAVDGIVERLHADLAKLDGF